MTFQTFSAVLCLVAMTLNMVQFFKYWRTDSKLYNKWKKEMHHVEEIMVDVRDMQAKAALDHKTAKYILKTLENGDFRCPKCSESCEFSTQIEFEVNRADH